MTHATSLGIEFIFIYYVMLGETALLFTIQWNQLIQSKLFSALITVLPGCSNSITNSVIQVLDHLLIVLSVLSMGVSLKQVMPQM